VVVVVGLTPLLPPSASRSYVIKKPKPDVAVSFSEDGSLLAVATRVDCKDHLALYSTETWAALRCFPLHTVDVAAVQW
jgi:hypothetical protein